MRKLVAAALVAFAAAGCAKSSEELMQSACVGKAMAIERALPDGADCYNFGYSDCDGFASDCVGYCAFNVCQPAPCVTDDDCAPSRPSCQELVIDEVAFGRWCKRVDPDGPSFSALTRD